MQLKRNLQRARRVRREEGTLRMCEKSIKYVLDKSIEVLVEKPLIHLYTDHIRPHTPTVGRQTLGEDLNHGEIKGYELKKFDGFAGRLWRKNHDPENERGFRLAHTALTRKGDHVGSIGGGRGLAAITAAQQVGDEGRVTIYDGLTGEDHHSFGIKHIEHNLEVNDVAHICETVHGIVGSSEEHLMYGDSSGELIHPSELPAFDVLEMDCNGFELDIIRHMEIEPRAMIIELEAPFYKEAFDGEEHPREVLDELSKRGYKILQQTGHEGRNISYEELLYLIDVAYERREKYRLDNGARAPPVLYAIHPNHI